MRCSLLTLSTYIDHEMPADKRAEVDAHLVGCDRCRQGLQYLEEEVERVQQLARVHITDGSAKELLQQMGILDENEALPARPAVRVQEHDRLTPSWLQPGNGGMPLHPGPDPNQPSLPFDQAAPASGFGGGGSLSDENSADYTFSMEPSIELPGRSDYGHHPSAEFETDFETDFELPSRRSDMDSVHEELNATFESVEAPEKTTDWPDRLPPQQPRMTGVNLTQSRPVARFEFSSSLPSSGTATLPPPEADDDPTRWAPLDDDPGPVATESPESPAALVAGDWEDFGMPAGERPDLIARVKDWIETQIALVRPRRAEIEDQQNALQSAGAVAVKSQRVPTLGRHRAAVMAEKTGLTTGTNDLAEKAQLLWQHRHRNRFLAAGAAILLVLWLFAGHHSAPKSQPASRPQISQQPKAQLALPPVAHTAPPSAAPTATPAPLPVTVLGDSGHGWQITQIRYGTHPSDLRMVFDMSAADESASGTPRVVIKFSSPTVMTITFNGVIPAGSVGNVPSGSVVSSVKLMPSGQSTTVYQLTLASPVTVSAMYLQSPLRLVIDLQS